MNMMKKIVSIFGLALGAVAIPLAAQADGDIVDIRCVDSTGRKFGGETGRNMMAWGELCRADNPLVAGETLCIRVRMLVRNAATVAASLGSLEPQTWQFWDKANAKWVTDPGSGVKLGLMIGEKPAYADYSPDGLNAWEFSGELQYDDNGNSTLQYRYYTDLYFKYTVKAGDMGLPIRLMNKDLTVASSTRSTTDYALYGLNVGIQGYELKNADGDVAELHFMPEGALEVEWPDGPWKGTLWDGRYCDYDLSKESAYVKTIDFDSAYANEEVSPKVWRYVHGGGVKGDDATLVVLAGGKATEGATLYVWSTNETVVVPAIGLQGTKLDTVKVAGVDRQVLTVQIPANGDAAAFRLKAAAGAAVGAKAEIFMSPNKESVYNPAGTLVNTSVSRIVEVTTTPAPSVNVRLDGKTTKAVKAGSAYADVYAAKLTVNIENDDPARTSPVAVTLKASVDGSTTLKEIDNLFSRNILRISRAEGFDLAAQAKDVTIPVGESSVTLYVYVLGATDETGEPGIRFEPVCSALALSETPAATLYIDCPGEEGVALTAKNPASGATVTVEENGALSFKVTLADTYKNMKDTTTGYTFYLDDVTAGGNSDTFLTKTKVVPKATGEATVTGNLAPEAVGGKTYQVELWAQAPDGVSTTVRIPFNLKVTDGRKVEIKPAGTSLTVGEGEEMPFNLGLNQQYAGAAKYIFIKGATAADEALFTSALTTTGALIDDDRQRVTGTRNVRLLDGSETTSLTLIAFVSDALDDPGMQDYAWAEGTVTVSVTNKPPVLNSLYVAGTYLTAAENGKPLEEDISMGVEKTFKLGSVTDVAADLDATEPGKEFKVKWIIDGFEYFTTGNPKDQTVTHTFNSIKDKAVIQVFLKDKDMSDYPTDPNFRCTARIVAKPFVAITTSAIGGFFNENDASSSSVTLSLSEAPTEEVEVKLTIQKSATGFLRLRTSEGSVTNAVDESGNVLENVYLVKFAAGVTTRSIFVSQMDGTNDTLGGLDLTAEVVTGTWKDYYTTATPVTVKVANVTPVFLRPTDAEVANTNMNASANTPYSVWYGVNDVSNDFAAVWADGSGAQGVKFDITVDGLSKTNGYLTSSSVQEFRAIFESEGDHNVTVTVTDKDGGTDYRTLYFFVQPSKTLELRARGPAQSVGGTANGFSSHYASGKARGLGAGHVWAGEGPQKVKRFVHTCSYGVYQQSVRAFAFGYKYRKDGVGGADDGNLDAPYDQGIDKDGNWTKGETIAEFYNYSLQDDSGLAGLDSFAYAWVCDNMPSEGDEKSGSLEVAEGRILALGESSEQNLQLPPYQKEAESYQIQNWEAVFAREYLASDNCGDINLDGVPDIFAVTYGFGAYDVSNGKFLEEGDDLADVSEWNEDGDMLLPTKANVSLAKLIPGQSNTWESAFTAKMEIRGRHDGLNDAGILLNVAYRVRPEPDFSELELAAAQSLGFADAAACYDKANNKWLWSPERATDPTKDDTDGDGLPDGYEYSFWYAAHVGDIDVFNAKETKGEVRRLTGRRYNPLYPDTGDVIGWQEIEDAFDPRSDIRGNKKSASEMAKRDFDNDGLTDLEEFVLGTNPVEWDTDGDGLPDGWEVMHGLDPLKEKTDDQNADGSANPDGDFMACATVPMTVLEAVDDDGRPKFFATTRALTLDDVPYGDLNACWRVEIGGTTYAIDGKADDKKDLFTSNVVVTVKEKVGGAPGETEEVTNVVWYLAKDLSESEAFSAKPQAVGDDAKLARGSGVSLFRGVKLDDEPTFLDPAGDPAGGYAYRILGVELPATGSAEDFTNRSFTAWRYGAKGLTTLDGTFCPFAIGKSAPLEAGAVIVGEVMSDQNVLLLHHNVYQWRGFYLNAVEAKKYGTLTVRKDMGTGFNPTTGWYRNKNTGCVNDRWVGRSTAEFEPAQDCSGIRDMAGFGAAAYPGKAVDTMAFATRDEFLLMNFRYNAGHIGKSAMEPAANETMQAVWVRETTLPVNGEGSFGADTDKDGVPDGWELYVATGPSVDDSSLGGTARFSPLKGDDSTIVETDWVTKMSYGSHMTLASKFAGTDTMIAYADVPSVADEANLFNKRWLNKFWPLDPWSLDTDCDGVPDHQEGNGKDGEENAIVGYIYSGTEIAVHSGIYGTPTDDGSKCIAGGGMNPNSWDTDLDGLPDLWEGQSDLSTPELSHHGWYVSTTTGNGTNAVTSSSFQGGMDPTVHDSYTRAGGVNRDYDHDGLQNWQEYMTGVIRAFRYDDALSPWTVPQWSEATGSDEMFLEALKTGKRLDPLTDGGSNPHLVFGKFDYLAAYGSQCRRPSDYACGYWYFFPDGPNHILRQGLATPGDGCPYAKEVKAAGQSSKVVQTYGPAMYFTCSPTCKDSDADGMDDYYELFHGMDPLYGGDEGRDLIALRWANGYPFNNVSAKNNLWTYTLKARGTSDDAKLYDFAVFPWMAGDPAADPDGDDIRNVDEAIQANAQANETWLHTDPTPLWMTDTSDPNSLVSRYYGGIASSADPDLKDQYAFAAPATVGETELPYVMPLAGHRWGVCNAWRVPKVDKRWGYSFVFEENDGYDTDHDGLSDAREAHALATVVSDPQDSDDPVRRQAMYFPGAKSALQARSDAVLGVDGKSELFFLEFTVECWVKPEDISRAQTILERVIRHPSSNPGDWNYIRRNFQLGIDENGHFFAAYDSNGTGTDRVIAAAETVASANAWAHLAATYDGQALVLYVNGSPAFTKPDNTHPATSAETVVTKTEDGLSTDVAKLASESAIVMGASIAPTAEFFSLVPGKSTWESYDRFYKGYLDEVRVWDGARDRDSIAADYRDRRRYTGADLLANREAVFAAWSKGVRRNLTAAIADTAETGTLPPELVYHYTFDGLFGAVEKQLVAQEPNGFVAGIGAHGKAAAARPANWVSPGWKNLSVHSLAYHDYAYVPWIPNLVAHLPAFDGTTLDSVYWSENYAGAESAGTFGYTKFGFPRTSEPEVNFVPVQQELNGFDPDSTRRSVIGEGEIRAFEFAKRARVLYATDLLPLGDAFVKYSTDFWDGEGAATVSDVSGKDTDFDNLPDWWEKLIAKEGSGYAMADGSAITPDALAWDTEIVKDGIARTAGVWYRITLAQGAHDTTTGGVLADETFAQKTDLDRDGMPDWWEDVYLGSYQTYTTADRDADPDFDGLSNYNEYRIAELGLMGAPLQLRLDRDFSDNVFYDYFRTNGLAGANRRYAGFVATDHDFIEDSFETEPERKVFSTHLDPEGNGWSKWSEARAKASWKPTVRTYTLTDTNGVARTVVYTNKAEYAGRPTPRVNVTLWGALEPQFYQATEVENAGTTNETSNVVTRAYSMYVEAYRGHDFSEAYWRGFIDGEPENGKLVATIDGEGLEEGLNTFVVRNGDATGYATANVGYDHVDLEIGLEAESAVVPAGIYGYNERMVIRRIAINGQDCEKRPVWMGKVAGTVSAAQVLANFENGVIDLDAKHLVSDAEELGIAADAIRTATYEIVDTYDYGDETWTYAYETFDKTFPLARPKATPLTPTADAANRVRSRKPTFTFTGLEGCTAFVLEIATEAAEGKTILATTNVLPAAWTSAGKSVREFKSDFQVGEGLDLADKTKYFWRVCGLSAKWTEAGAWSDWMAFETAVDSTDGATGYGKLTAEVRYYGAATNDTSDVIVGVFTDVAFAGKPVATARLKTGNFADLAVAKPMSECFEVGAGALGTVTFDGLVPGDYYVMAFNDRNGNGRRDAWETWGYVNKVGQRVEDRFTPVALMVVANTGVKAAAGVLFMEDTDVNDNALPDCIEDEFVVKVAPATDADGDGLDDADEFWSEYLWGGDPELWDTDGDLLPDGYEVWAGSDPFDAWDFKVPFTYTDTNGYEVATYYRTSAADVAVEGDTMAYAMVTRKVVEFRNAVDGTSYYVTVDADDTTPYKAGGTLTAGRRYRMVSFYATLPAAEWNGYAYGENYYCLGANYDATANDVVVQVYDEFPIMLVHWQVYQEFGFESGVATPNGMVHTRPMYGIDKYLVARLLGREEGMNKLRRWGRNLTCLKPGVADFDGDGINDGWELYVMFPGLTDVTPGISPWVNSDGYDVTAAGREWKGFAWTDAEGETHEYADGEYDVGKMYNGGVDPSDPYDQNSLLPGTGIDDKTARKYNVETAANQLNDNDSDGLSNWAEYVAATDGTVPEAANLDVNAAFSDGLLLDYFRTNGLAGDARRYLGELVADHDFIEDTWEDLYDRLTDGSTDGKFVSRDVFDAQADTDDDGWSNWSEARAGTDPTSEAMLSLVSPANGEDNVLGQYPTPILKTTVTYDSAEALTAPIVVRAWKNEVLSSAPDARWTVTGSGDATTEHVRFLGLNPGDRMTFNLGPGSVAPESVEIGIFDPNYQVETRKYDTNGTLKSTKWSLSHTARNSKWAGYVYTDHPVSAGSEIGSFMRRMEGDSATAEDQTKKASSWVNYRTGEISIDFAEIQDPDVMLRISDSDEEKVFEHYNEVRSYIRVKWFSRVVTAGNTKTIYLSKPDDSTEKSPNKGHLREGLHTFVAFADLNGDGEWQDGEPYGVMRDVDIGYDTAEINIALTDAKPGLPRFNVSPTNLLETVRIVRETVNDKTVTPVCVWAKALNFSSRSEVTEADYLADGSWDLDARDLLADMAARENLDADGIRKVGYAVYLGYGDATPIHTFERTFEPFLAPVVSASGMTLRAARPTFSWKSEGKCPAYVLQVAKADDADFATPVYVETNFYTSALASGFVCSPAIYVGKELDDGADYIWRVADYSAFKADLLWSETAKFSTAVDSTNADTGYGKLAAEIRYYGPSTNMLDEVVVEVYGNAGFAGVPVARKVLGAADKSVATLASAATPFMTVVKNVEFDGIAPGSYYVAAYVDGNGNGRRDDYETWGYYNNVGTGSAALYTPMTLTVKATKGEVASGIVFMEDTDVNDNGTPDCLEDMTGYVREVDKPVYRPGEDSDDDGDGLTYAEELAWGTDPKNPDTDGDGMPDGWEVDNGLRPLVEDRDTAAPYDVMAKASVSAWVYAVTNASGTVVARYVEKAGVNELVESAVTNALYTTFTVDGDDALYVGAPTDFDRTAAASRSYETNVVLIHSAVYDWYGFDATTAVPTAGTNAANTVAFTAWDKYVTVAGYLPEFGVDDCTSLKPGRIDGDNNGLPDGWELYVGFATDTRETNPNLAAPTFPLSGVAATTAKNEFDNGFDVADPWNKYWFYEQTFGPKEEAYKRTDVRLYTNDEARRYDIVKGDTTTDRDLDGLTNYDELQAKWDLALDLSVTNVFSNGTTPDYFRANAGVYTGEKYNGAEFIEGNLRTAMGLDDRTMSGTRDYKDTGWDEWSTARFSINKGDGSSSVTGVSEELMMIIRYYNSMWPGEFTGSSQKEALEFFHEKEQNVIRIVAPDGTYNEIQNKEENAMTLSWPADYKRYDADATRTTEGVINFFGGKTVMLAKIAENSKGMTAADITTPEAEIAMTLRYAGNGPQNLNVEAYQINRAYPELGVQQTAKWTVAANFESGFAKVSLSASAASALVQGEALFVAYVGDDVKSSTVYGVAQANVGYTGAEVAITLGDQNPALPKIDVSSVSNATAGCRLAIVRSEINGQPLGDNVAAVYVRGLENNLQREVLYPTEWVSKSFIGVDRYFDEAEGIAKAMGIDTVHSVTYDVLVGCGTWDKSTYLTNAVQRFTVNYDAARSIPKNLRFATATEGDVTFSFDLPEGDYPYTKFWMTVTDDATGKTTDYGDVRGFVLPNAAGKVVTVDPADYGVNLAEGNYRVSFAIGNDKFGAPAEGDFCAALPVTVNAERAYNGSYLVTVKHPTADLAGGNMTVAAYEAEDLANPVAIVTNADCASPIELANLRAGKKYYLAAWYVVDAADGRKDATVRAPYDTWGYLCAFDQSSACFAPFAVEAKEGGAPVTFYVQDTDWNDNGKVDREEAGATGIAYPYSTLTASGDVDDAFWPVGPEPQPWDPVFEPEETDDVNADTGDAMAYFDIADVLLVKVGTSEADAAWYAVMDLNGEGEKLRDEDIPLQTEASKIDSLVTTWSMAIKSADDEPVVGVGRAADFTGSAAKVLAKRYATVRLVHAQVYAKFGFESGCAAYCVGNVDPRLDEGVAAMEHPHSKAFTNWDKWLVGRYLEAIGVEGDASVTDLYSNGCYEWWTDLNRRDSDNDGVADGWELYTMFGVTDLKAFMSATLGALADAKVSPWDASDAKKKTTEGGLTLVEEFDGGYWPTDPWSVDTDSDGVIDVYAYQYHLKGDDAGKDFDLDEDGNWVGDGLSNYAEYLVSEVFQIAKLDSEKVKTNGSCVDYFRKMGELYLGEIFTDHDQVDDTWEALYPEVANRYVYDPDRDEDKDGWTNYEEFRAGTDPSAVSKVEVAKYTKNEYPIPVIEAKVVYNGSEVNLGSIVFKAWNEKADQDMTGMPDAIWTFGNGEKAEGSGSSSSSGSSSGGAVAGSTETGSSAESNEKYLGRRTSGQRRMVLGGGSVVPGTVAIKFLDESFEQISTSNATAAADALWYVGATDKGGKLTDFRGNEIGTVDYKTGLATFDCAKMTGKAIGLPNSTGTWTQTLIVDEKTAPNTGASSYDVLTLDNAHMLIVWQAQNIGLSPTGEYLLADVDPVTNSDKSRGHVRSGKNTFFCFADTKVVNGEYDPGEPFGVVRGVDVGWQGAKFKVELAETSAITPRISLMGGTTAGAAADDRSETFDGDFNQVLLNQRLNGVTNIEEFLGAHLDKSPMPTDGKQARIRVVRYAVDDLFCYTVGVGSQSSHCLDQLVVMDKVFNPEGRAYLCEADFLGNGKFDIDWDTLTGTTITQGAIVNMSGNALPGGPQWAELDVTNMTYLVVIGEDTKDVNKYDSNTVHVVSTLVTRRFEKTRHVPTIISPSVGAYVYGARPTFRWAIPDEEDWAKKFGSSYTAFRLQILDGEDVVYDSDIRRAPVQTEKGVFEWKADAFAGDQLPVGNYTWKVSMYNAKFRSDAWSDLGSFTIATGTQQETDDHTYSSLEVSVKYTGPALVLNDAGFVRVQAFETADFSGTPVAQTRITDIASVKDVSDIRKNGTLIGLPFGTYYVRAYIDTNKNGVKDDWESWGGTKEPIKLTANQPAPIDGLYIEDADTDQDWLPDAWEYAKYGNLSEKGAEIDPEGKIVLKQTVYDGIVAGQANISKFLSGASLTFFQNIGNVSLALGIDETTEKSIAEIRAMVEKNIDPNSVKITSLTVDATSGKVYLTVAAKATDSIAGHLLSPLYEIPKSTDVTIKIYRKENLATDEWKLEKTVPKTIESTLSEKVEVDTGVNFASGFYKVEVEQ